MITMIEYSHHPCQKQEKWNDLWLLRRFSAKDSKRI